MIKFSNIKFSTYIIRKEYCRSCLVCIPTCPLNAIIHLPDNTLKIDQSRCDSCGKCVDSCKLRAIKKINRPRIVKS